MGRGIALVVWLLWWRQPRTLTIHLTQCQRDDETEGACPTAIPLP